MEVSNTTPSNVEPENMPTLSRNQQMSQTETSSAAVFRHVRRCGGRRRRTHVRKIVKDGCNGGGEEFREEKAEVEKKIVALQKIVPGGEKLPVAELFEETAEYILALEWQVKALRFLAAVVEGSDKEKRKLGG